MHRGRYWSEWTTASYRAAQEDGGGGGRDVGGGSTPVARDGLGGL